MEEALPVPPMPVLSAPLKFTKEAETPGEPGALTLLVDAENPSN